MRSTEVCQKAPSSSSQSFASPSFRMAGLRAKLKATRIAKLDCRWRRTPNAISLHPRRGTVKFPGSPVSGRQYSPFAAGDSPSRHLSIE